MIEAAANASAAAETLERKEANKPFEGGELPDDSGNKPYKSDLPNDSGVKPNRSDLPDDSGHKQSKNDLQEYLSTLQERLGLTPKEGERGHWTGDRGESKYIPTNEAIKNMLGKFGLDGIEYRKAIPNFSECAEDIVRIDNMSTERLGEGKNYNQCDQKCAEHWNNVAKDGKTDWIARDVAYWRDENGYTWHECNDRKTCQLIPTEVNDYFGHLGGVSECGKVNKQEGGFDE